ncbi:MAG: hypothetical protein UHS54_11690 [Lachnospiraceae bacterium]|nr:hypothetical protein [Lachnospiraceae bacterium]
MGTSRRVNSRSDYYRTHTYIDGNTVRKTTVAVPQHEADVQERLKQRRTSREISRNRKKALQMSKSYVLFLALVSVAALFMCVRFIQLRSTVTSQLKELASMESELNQLTAENDALYNQTVNDVDLEHIKDVAMNQLGMNYATEDQIIWYSNNATNSYVRQYQDVTVE